MIGTSVTNFNKKEYLSRQTHLTKYCNRTVTFPELKNYGKLPLVEDDLNLKYSSGTIADCGGKKSKPTAIIQ